VNLLETNWHVFLQQKCNIVPFDDLVTIATDFYTAEEIKGAVAAVYSHVEQRPPAYKGTDKDRKTVEGILKLFLNPNIELPTFVAVDISRLPPVSVDHMDTSALLQELALLRYEVRAIRAIRAELEEMKAAVKTLQQSASLTLQQGPDPSSVRVIGAVDDTTLNNPSAAQLRLQSAIQSGSIQRVNKPVRRRLVVGKMTLKDDKVKPVAT